MGEMQQDEWLVAVSSIGLGGWGQPITYLFTECRMNLTKKESGPGARF